MNNKKFYSIDEAAEITGWNRATVFAWVKTLGMKIRRFERVKKSYLAAADVTRLKEIKEKPWTAPEQKPEEPVA